jgi:spermidine synthase
MQVAEQAGSGNFVRRVAEVRPRIYQDRDSMSLQFQIGEIQSEMRISDPNRLVLSYTRAMISFLHLLEEPKRIAMIGLGGGSMAKWCYHHLHASDITVIEISPMVIALRDQFHIPADDHRFRVICGDGADYVASTVDSPQVLLVDGFDVHGLPPQLCSQAFYEDCYRALAPDGLMVGNLCGSEEQRAMDRIRRTFEDRVLVIIPEDGENKVVFAGKGRPRWIEEQPADHLGKSLRANDALTPSLLQP